MSEQEPSHRPPSRIRSLVGTLVPASPSEEAEPEASDSAPIQKNDRWPRWFGIGVIVLAFGVAGTWGATAKIDGAVVAPGTVTVDSYRQTVEHLEGGIVERVYVESGDVVEEGDLLVQLDQTQPRAEYLANWNRYVSALARQARLQAELEGREAIDFPEEVAFGAKQNDAMARARRTQQREFEARKEALEGEISVLRERIDELEERVEGMQAQRAATRRMIESLEEELASKRRLVEREAMPAAELRPLERELAEAEGRAGELKASIAASRVQMKETEQEIIQRRREFHRETATALREVSNRVNQLEEELRALEDTLARTQIRAPVSGEVVDLQVHSRRSVVRGGEPILDIVPKDEELLLEGEVRPRDIDNVDPGMTADVRFTAFSFRRTPVITGEVTYVSADRIEEQDREPYYRVRAKVPQDEVDKLGDNVRLRPGMPADIMIKTGERTPFQYLAKPIADAIARSFRED